MTTPDMISRAKAMDLEAIDRQTPTPEARNQLEFVYTPPEGADIPLAVLCSDLPIPVPRLGDTVSLHGVGPLQVTGIHTNYEITTDGAIFAGVTVTVTPAD